MRLPAMFWPRGIAEIVAAIKPFALASTALRRIAMDLLATISSTAAGRPARLACIGLMLSCFCFFSLVDALAIQVATLFRRSFVCCFRAALS